MQERSVHVIQTQRFVPVIEKEVRFVIYKHDTILLIVIAVRTLLYRLKQRRAITVQDGSVVIPVCANDIQDGVPIMEAGHILAAIGVEIPQIQNGIAQEVCKPDL